MKAQRVSLNGREMTLYEFFGVEEKSSAAELKIAYRRLCLRFHPDTAADKKSAERNFKEIQNMWRILGDETLRARYDAALAEERNPSPKEDFPTSVFMHFYWHGMRATYGFNDSGNFSSNARSWSEDEL